MPLQKKELADYNALKSKACRLRKEIERHEAENYLHDVVTGSSPTPPYQKGAIVINGYDSSTGTKRATELKAELVETERQIRRVEQCVDGIYPVVVQEALKLKYIGGHTWAETVGILNYQGTSDALRILVSRKVK